VPIRLTHGPFTGFILADIKWKLLIAALELAFSMARNPFFLMRKDWSYGTQYTEPGNGLQH
jgi:hypothetical protein